MEILVAAIVFVALFGGAGFGMWGARRLKEHHLSKETQDAVKLGVGMVAAMSSLILGLMTASVKGNFDSTGRDVQQFATYLITITDTLRDYGPEADEARAVLAGFTRHLLAQTWREQRPSAGGAALAGPDTADPTDHLQLSAVGQAIRALEPHTSTQTQLKSDALDRYKALSALRWTVIEESVTAVPPIFTTVLIVWLTLIFVSFGLFAPVNRISVGAFVLCALSLAGAIFLILEMSSPFDGVIAVSPSVVESALTYMTQ